jgi:DNA-binding NtrC family response regulator
MLQAYGWPGNVRELENVVERAVILSRDTVIEPSVLPPEVRSDISTSGAQLVSLSPMAPPRDDGFSPEEANLRDSLEEYERALIRGALRRAGGVQIEAARALGISESNLRYKLKKLDLSTEAFSG